LFAAVSVFQTVSRSRYPGDVGATDPIATPPIQAKQNTYNPYSWLFDKESRLRHITRREDLPDKEKVRRINALIMYAGRRLERRMPFLRHRNAIGLGIFLFGIAGMITMALLYWRGVAPAWLVIPASAVFASLLHELEHDMIHSLYFKNTWVEKVMMMGVWLFRGIMPNPFWRKKVHLLHHRMSGQGEDIEEQIIGNGMALGPKRLIVMLDQQLAFLIVKHRIASTAPEWNSKQVAASAVPFSYVFYTASYTWMTLSLLYLFGVGFPEWVGSLHAGLTLAAVVYLLPNILVRASVQIVSSSMHYFGDVKRGPDGLVQQVQVLTPWYLGVFQLFCFNFGSTHAIHHFVVNQPFYIRQMVTPIAHRAFRKYGVRFNDNATFTRSNRYRLTTESA